MKPTYEELAQRLANAESKCMGLAAENTRAKKIISECREYFIAGVMNRIRPTNEGYLHMICDTFEDETPATDAFLAEISERSLNAFMLHCEEKLNTHIKKSSDEFDETSIRLRHVFVSAYLFRGHLRQKSRASQLRKGGAAQSCPHCGGIGTCSEHGCTATDQMIERYRASQEVTQ